MAKISKPEELVLTPYLKVLIYGQAGTGKTSLALSSKNPLLFDFDNGIHRVDVQCQKDTVQINSYQDMLDILEKEDLNEYDTIVIDTAGKMLDYMGAYLIKRNPKLGQSNGALTLRGYGERKMEFISLVKRLTLMRKHIIFVAHRETKTEGDDTRYIPLFGGSNYDSLVTELDLVGYIEMNGTNRSITFNPTSRNDGKNTCNLPALMQIPELFNEQGDMCNENNFIEQQIIKRYQQKIKKDRENLNKHKELVALYEEKINSVKTKEELEAIVEELKEITHIGNSKIKIGQIYSKKLNELNAKV